jgi:hypothetical protein
MVDRRVWLSIAGLTMLLGTSAPARQEQSADASAASVLAAAREALGGAAVLDTVKSLTANGSFNRTVNGRSNQSSIEFAFEAPYRFVSRDVRSTGGGPIPPFNITSRNGFDGDVKIHEIDAPGAPFPVVFPAELPKDPVALAALEARQLAGPKQTFVKFFLPLFVDSPAAFPLRFTHVGQEDVDGAPADVIQARGPDDFVLKLFVDVKTRLPVLLTWMAKPLVTWSSSSLMTVPGRGGPPVAPPPPDFPPGDPAAGLALVEYRMSISHYQISNGLNWPRRFTVRVAGRVQEETRISRYRINPTIPASTFRTTNRDRR